MNSVNHIPVLLNEVLDNLFLNKNKTYIDATFGGGGYTRAILDNCDCNVIAIDRDPNVIKTAEKIKEIYKERFEFLLSNFGNLEKILEDKNFEGIVFDFGVSSFQLDTAERGFSFRLDGPLDMRMGNTEITADEIVNTYKQDDIYKIIKFYGEERFAKKISKAIVENRPILNTIQLANIIRSVTPKNGHIDQATKTFQALRIFVNDELREIEQALNGVLNIVRKNNIPSLNVVTVTFHSLEDRIVKNWSRNNNVFDDNIEIISNKNKVIVPTNDELLSNPRSRSAKLRSFLIKNRSCL